MIINKRRFLSAIGLGGMASALAACNTLSLFNALTPKDARVRRVARDVAYGDDPRQRYDVYAPDSAKVSSLPFVVFFYGGGWNSGSKDDYAWMGHALAAMGHVVAVPDYRLVPQVHFPDFVNDCAQAVRHGLAHAASYGADPSRLGLMGHSAGAYNAAMLTLDPALFGPDSSGRSKVSAFVGVSGPYDFYPFDVSESINAFGQWPEPVQTQPVTYAAHTDTHMFLLQSRADTLVGTKNAVNLNARLLAAGDDVRLKLYDGLSHQDMAAAFSIPFRGKGTLYADVKAFLKEAL